MKRIIIEIVAFVLCLTLLLSLTSYLGYMLMPNRTDFGATWTMFVQEPEDSIDVVLLGSSMVYCNVIPSEIYENTGITSYVISGGTLTCSIGYYYLKETLRTQSPDVVMIEATSAFFKQYEKFTKANVGYMPYSLNRLGAIFNASEPEERLGLLFPLYNYHDTWEDRELGYFFGQREDVKTDPYAGYTYLTDISPQSEPTQRTVEATDEEIKNNFAYLEKSLELCRDNGIRPVLFLSPTYASVLPEHKEMLYERFPDEDIINFSDSMVEMDIDPMVDFYDANHFNVTGAVKFSEFLGNYMKDNFTISERAHDETLWRERVEHFEQQSGK